MRIQGKVIAVAGLMISISMNLFAQEPGRNRRQPPSGTTQRIAPVSPSPRVVQGNYIGTSVVVKPNTTRQQQAPAAAMIPQANTGNSSNLVINGQSGNDAIHANVHARTSGSLAAAPNNPVTSRTETVDKNETFKSQDGARPKGFLTGESQGPIYSPASEGQSEDHYVIRLEDVLISS